MQIFSTASAFLLFWSSANAAAAAVCKADDCLRQVRDSRTSAFSLTASRDCSSFLVQTVTPCASTTTTTSTVTATAPAITQTSSATVSTTAFETVIESQTTTVTTIVDTVTSSSPVPITETVTQVVTSSAFVPVNKKRDVTSICSTSTASAIPRYASSCNVSRYSTACSCIGVTRSVATAAQPTVTSTVTTTVTTTPTTVITNTVVNTATETQTQTTLIPVTLETGTTTFVPSTYTVTSTVTSTTTATVLCGQYKIIVTSETRKGQYIRSDMTNGVYYFVTDPSRGSIVTLDGTTMRNEVGAPVVAYTGFNRGANIFPYSRQRSDYVAVICSTTPISGTNTLSLYCYLPNVGSGWTEASSSSSATILMGGPGNAVTIALVPAC